MSELREKDKWCSDCEREKKYIGCEYAEVLDFEPGGFFAEKTQKCKYACD